MRKLLIAVSALTIMTISSSAMASNDDIKCENPAGTWLAEDVIKSKAEAEGYTVKRVKREDSCYEVYAINKKDERVEIYMNPATGAIVEIEIED